MTHYVGPRAAVAVPSGTQSCPRCRGRGFIHYNASGRVLRRADYSGTAFWRTCSLCGGVGHVDPDAQEPLAA